MLFLRNMIRFVKYDENLCLNDKIYRMMIVLMIRFVKVDKKGLTQILQKLNEISFLLNLTRK